MRIIDIPIIAVLTAISTVASAQIDSYQTFISYSKGKMSNYNVVTHSIGTLDRPLKLPVTLGVEAFAGVDTAGPALGGFDVAAYKQIGAMQLAGEGNPSPLYFEVALGAALQGNRVKSVGFVFGFKLGL